MRNDIDGFEKDLKITGLWSFGKKLQWTIAELFSFVDLRPSAIKIWMLWTYKKPKVKVFTVFCKACNKQVEPVDELGGVCTSGGEYEYCCYCHRLLGKRL